MRPIIVVPGFLVPGVLEPIYLAAFDNSSSDLDGFKSDIDYSSSEEKIAPCPRDGVRAANIRVDDSALNIQERDVQLEHIYKLWILEARNTTLESGGLDVIMGLSGSCKISLLILTTRPA